MTFEQAQAEKGGKPNAMMEGLWRPLIDAGAISPENAARFSFVIEEALFSGVLLNIMPWFLAVLGFPSYMHTVFFFAVSNIFFGFLHTRLYYWRARGGFYRGGAENIRLGYNRRVKGKEVVDLGEAGIKHQLGFIFLGAIFRCSYLIPGFNGLASLVIASGAHAFYNNVVTNVLNLFVDLPLAMAGKHQMELALSDSSDVLLREQKLMDHKVYTPGRLTVVKHLYQGSKRKKGIDGLSTQEKISIWQYMILAGLTKRDSALFTLIDKEIKRLEDEDEEVEGVYMGYEWPGTRGLKVEDTVNTVMDNVDIRPGERMLDIGCGAGKVIIHLALVRPQVAFAGVDANPYNIADAITSLIEMGDTAPQNVRFHIRDCRSPEPGQTRAEKGIPYKDNVFTVVSMLGGVMDAGDMDDSWQLALWKEAIRVADKEKGRVVFYGLKGAGAFYRSIPEGLDVEKQKTYFNINGEKKKKFYPGWGRIDDYHWDGTDFCVWNFVKKRPRPAASSGMDTPSKVQDNAESSAEQLSLFGRQNKGPFPGKDGSWKHSGTGKLLGVAPFIFFVDNPIAAGIALFLIIATMRFNRWKKPVELIKKIPVRAMYFTVLGTLSGAVLASMSLSATNRWPVMVASFFMIAILTSARLIEKMRLKDYIRNLSDKLSSVKDRSEAEKEEERKEVHKLFSKIVRLFESYFIRDLVAMRKKLLSEAILINIRSEEGLGAMGSVIRSDEASHLMIEEIFTNPDRSIRHNGIETMLETLTHDRHGFFFARFHQLLKESGDLPRFQKDVFEILKKAARGKSTKRGTAKVAASSANIQKT